MDHQDALREMSVEKYLLGELTGEARDTFEEHLFECQLCAADLKSGVTFAQAARLELAATPEIARTRNKSRNWASWLLAPQWLAPAFAACLLLAGYQSFFRVPGLERQLTQAESPHVLSALVLTDGATRGGGLPTVTVPAQGAVLLSVDLPPHGEYASYVCSLYSPSGKVVWKGSVLPSQAQDTVQISVPAAAAEPGENTLLIQGMRQGGPSSATLDDLVRRQFVLEIQK